jgi:hypothetical protein
VPAGVDSDRRIACTLPITMERHVAGPTHQQWAHGQIYSLAASG